MQRSLQLFYLVAIESPEKQFPPGGEAQELCGLQVFQDLFLLHGLLHWLGALHEELGEGKLIYLNLIGQQGIQTPLCQFLDLQSPELGALDLDKPWLHSQSESLQLLFNTWAYRRTALSLWSEPWIQG